MSATPIERYCGAFVFCSYISRNNRTLKSLLVWNVVVVNGLTTVQYRSSLLLFHPSFDWLVQRLQLCWVAWFVRPCCMSSLSSVATLLFCHVVVQLAEVSAVVGDHCSVFWMALCNSATCVGVCGFLWSWRWCVPLRLAHINRTAVSLGQMPKNT